MGEQWLQAFDGQFSLVVQIPTLRDLFAGFPTKSGVSFYMQSCLGLFLQPQVSWKVNFKHKSSYYKLVEKLALTSSLTSALVAQPQVTFICGN